MNQTRFDEKPAIDPHSVMTLANNHPAMLENRTLFPSTVVTVRETTPERLLVSGVNNRKIGKTVVKGKFAGYAIYGLSLEERATCPKDCDARAACYGNSMQMARRHRIGDPDVFFARLESEIETLLKTEAGLLIRLHVLGDFPSVEYVAFWTDILDEHPNVAVYGYTHRLPLAYEGDEIGESIQAAKDRFQDRFRVRHSFPVPLYDGASIIVDPPESLEEDGVKLIVCPSQTDKTACCATCALCWETQGNSILFYLHGRSVPSLVAEKGVADQVIADDGSRAIAPIPIPSKPAPAVVSEGTPAFRVVDPSTLRVDPAYQRNLSTKSVGLIRHIVANWQWSKFKPPICAETPAGLFVIDGQHTAIAAASHPSKFHIPVMIVDAATSAGQADSFIAHNRDRVAMSQFEIFHAEVAAGRPHALAIARAAKAAGAVIPRSQPAKGRAVRGQIGAVSEVASAYGAIGEAALTRVLKVMVEAGMTPINTRPFRAVRKVLSGLPEASDIDVTRALAGIGDIETESRLYAAQTGQDQVRACIKLIEAAMASARAAA